MTGAGLVQRNVVTSGQCCCDQRDDLRRLRQRATETGRTGIASDARAGRICCWTSSELRLQPDGTGQNADPDPRTSLHQRRSTVQVKIK